jgi:hypothetical protein
MLAGDVLLSCLDGMLQTLTLEPRAVVQLKQQCSQTLLCSVHGHCRSQAWLLCEVEAVLTYDAKDER